MDNLAALSISAIALLVVAAPNIWSLCRSVFYKAGCTTVNPDRVIKPPLGWRERLK